MSSIIESELIKCRQAAEEGYKLARDNYAEIQNTLSKAKSRVASANAEQSKVSRIQNTELIKAQEKELGKLEKSIGSIGYSLENLRKSQKDFSIVVYGRTMAGKSTLMEILTHGNGKSIGNGSQRTTRDVRDYYWNGLKITDVPGICAFEGAEDEKLAMDAAKSADLILFLLTSDAPQADEAACLAQLKKLGKPVLGLINVKMSFNINDDLDIEDLQDLMSNTSNVDAILSQFKKFAASHNQDWSGIKFVATHLLAAFQSQDKNDKIFEISRFPEVEEFILEKVRNDGRFLRIKTFVDSVAVPMNNIILAIYRQSGNALIESDIWLDKRVQLGEWRKDFLARSQKKLDAMYDELSDILHKEIYRFSESHYEDEKVNENWPRAFQNLGFDTKYQNLLQSFSNECERKRRELSDELTQELSLSLGNKMSTGIELEGTTTWGQYGAAALGGLGGLGGFVAARAIGFAFPPLGIALGVISFVGWLFSDSKEEKIRKAKAKLREDLQDPSFEMLSKMHSQVIEVFNKEILDKAVDEFWDMLADYQHMLARLGQSQSEMADNLFYNYQNLNAVMLDEAVDYVNAGSYSNAKNILRIPGEHCVLLADRSNLNANAISDLLGEKFITMKPKEKLIDTVEIVLGCDYEVESHWMEFDTEEKEAEKAYSIIPKDKVDETKFKLAQQIAGIPIIEV